MSITILSIWCIVATIALLMMWKSQRDYSSVREDIDRMREEQDIIIDFLHTTAEDMSSGELDKTKLYRRIVRTTAITCGAMTACLYEKTDDNKLVSRATEGLFPPQTRRISKQGNMLRAKFLEEAIVQETLNVGESVIGTVAEKMRGIIIKDAMGDSRVIEHGDESLQVKSMIAVPVAFGNKLYGVLAIANPISEKPFNSTDFSLALSLGEQAGMALHNMDALSAIILKNKMEFDLRLASDVQKYLLPSTMPDTQSLQFAVKYIPQQLIGGDFYDFYKLPNNRIGITVGDVSGKGVSASLIMAICRTKLQALAHKNKSPSETLKELNADIVESMRTDMFITMTYAIIDTNASKITLARAGHEPALLYKSTEPTSPAIKIRGSGMAVGMVDSELFDESIENVEFEFNKGDVFVLYTDGITEALNKADEEYTTARLASTISKFGTQSAKEMNDAIIKDVETFSDKTKHADDLTLLCVKQI